MGMLRDFVIKLIDGSTGPSGGGVSPLSYKVGDHPVKCSTIIESIRVFGAVYWRLIRGTQKVAARWMVKVRIQRPMRVGAAGVSLPVYRNVCSDIQVPLNHLPVHPDLIGKVQWVPTNVLPLQPSL